MSQVVFWKLFWSAMRGGARCRRPEIRNGMQHASSLRKNRIVTRTVPADDMAHGYYNFVILGRRKTMYLRFFKRFFDVVLSGIGLIVLAIPMAVVAVAIKMEDPGPIIFKQKRVGIHKKYFSLYKFRSMRMDTPHDMPTHLLKNPQQYILKTGAFIRKTSIDELPQLVNILRGDMSIIGPRPALWNQDDLIAERDKYGANDVKPGLTGWAQINGRDELEITDKAKLDGEYVARMGFGMDVKCFLGTIKSVLKSDGVVEGGTGEMRGRTEVQELKEETVIK